MEAFDANWERFEQRWITNTGQHTPADSVDFVAERVGIELAGDLRDRLVEGFRVVGETVPLELGAGVVGRCPRCGPPGSGSASCATWVTPSPTRGSAHRLGLLDSFDAWAFSDDGWFKPAKDAFAPALEGLGIADPSSAAHVGDSRRTDVAGALALGMISVRFIGFHDRPAPGEPEAHHVIDDLRDLPGVLGLA